VLVDRIEALVISSSVSVPLNPTSDEGNESPDAGLSAVKGQRKTNQ